MSAKIIITFIMMDPTWPEPSACMHIHTCTYTHIDTCVDINAHMFLGKHT